MYITIDSASQFRDEFNRAGRGNQFSHEALGLLFDHIQEADPQHELDVIALCCDYTESTWQTIAADYSIDIDETENDYEQKAAVLDYLADEGALVGETDGGSIVYGNFLAG
jgi:hypothetical protein